MQANAELLAPAGSYESLRAAIQGGANAVYFGVEQLNMRARATMNFTIEDLEQIVAICRAAGVRTYLTLNTIIYDHDITLMNTVVRKAKEAGVDAVIASDLAVIQSAAEAGMPVHISTQLNVTNIAAVQFYARFADVMVLSRELSLRQVKQICDAIRRQQIKGPSGALVKIEVFAHGALCMAVSGKCYLSLHTQNASANRGACVQNCRRRYKVVDLEEGHELEIDNEYIMSPKDLCTIDFLDELLGTGVAVLKIEGRGKSADYVKTVTRCYREAIDCYYRGDYADDKVQGWISRMEEVYNRGFWGGYYLGKELGEWTDAAGSKATLKKIYIGKGSHYYPKKKIAEFSIEAYSLKKGDRILVIGPQTGVQETIVESLHVNEEGEKDIAVKGDVCAFPFSQPVKTSDKLYKLVAADEEEK
ncbi:MAG TPA: peptidase U32 family protein [Chitinophagaceae bacterium]